MKVIVDGIVDVLTAKDTNGNDISEVIASGADRSLKHKWNDDAQGYELTAREREHWKDVFKRQNEFVERVDRLIAIHGKDAVMDVVNKVSVIEYPQYYIAVNEELDLSFGKDDVN